jgi:hypothetical protein
MRGCGPRRDCFEDTPLLERAKRMHHRPVRRFRIAKSRAADRGLFSESAQRSTAMKQVFGVHCLSRSCATGGQRHGLVSRRTSGLVYTIQGMGTICLLYRRLHAIRTATVGLPFERHACHPVGDKCGSYRQTRESRPAVASVLYGGHASSLSYNWFSSRAHRRENARASDSCEK